jgi:glycosyltransferase involved in cell wall biosynthesis
MKGLLLIPAFNEQATIGPLVAAARNYLNDILVIDDGSVDATASIAAAEGATVLRMAKNMGKGAALKAGFAHALERSYNTVITMDADGQHDPRDLEFFLPVAGQYDLVLGNRMEEQARIPALRRIANLTSSRIVSAVSGQPIFDSQSGFRAYSLALLRQVRLDCSHYDLETEVIIKAARLGFRIGHCRIRTIYAGEVSRFRQFKDSLRFLKVIVKSMAKSRDTR